MGKFDHINPDEVYILDYSENASRLYLVKKDEYLNPTKKDEDGYSAQGIRVSGTYEFKWGSAFVSSSKPAKERTRPTVHIFITLTTPIKNLFKKENPELYKHFEDFYNKPKTFEFSNNPEDYWFFTRGYGWELIERIDWRHADRQSEVKTVNWKDGKIRFVTPDKGFVNHSFQDLVRTGDHKMKTLGEQNPEQFKKYLDYYTPKELPKVSKSWPLPSSDPSDWLFYLHEDYIGHLVCIASPKYPSKYWIVNEDKNTIDCHSGNIHSTDRFIPFDKTSPKLRSKLEEHQPELYQRFENYYSKPRCGCNQPDCIHCSPSPKREALTDKQQAGQFINNGSIQRSTHLHTGSDFDIDKRKQFIQPNKGRTMHDALGLFQEKPTLEDWATVINPYNIINSLLTNNNEKSIVQTKAKCHTGRKELRGTGIQSNGSTPSITEGYFTDPAGLISGKKRTGRSKISVSI